jgi:hypothetical protein
LPLGQLPHTCAGLRDSLRRSVEESATVVAMRSTARRALACEREAAELEVQLDRLVVLRARSKPKAGSSQTPLHATRVRYAPRSGCCS